MNQAAGTPMPAALQVRAAGRGDLPAIVAAHLASFEGFVLSRLGPRFLNELYGAFLTQPDGVLVVAVLDDRLAGFAAGTTRPHGFFGRLLLRRGWAFALAAVPALLGRPGLVARRLVAALGYRGESPSAAVGRAALLSSIALLPVARGSGAAALLVEAFAARARDAGCTILYLTTDRDANDAVNDFYARLGFELRDSIRREGGRTMNRWMRRLAPAAPAPSGTPAAGERLR